MHNTQKVFGVSNEQVESYIERVDVDTIFLNGLKANKHIIVFGSSKQGKTALTNKHLPNKEFVRVNCSPEMHPDDIYKSILRQQNIHFRIESSSSTTFEGTIQGGVKAKVSIPLLGSAEVNGGSSGKVTNTNSTKTVEIDYNLCLPQDISEILRRNGFDKRIILENFHYLTEEVQSSMAYHLRVFEDYNILFIILGIWREKNRLAQFNGDLQDRLIEVPVEPWKVEDLRAVATIGEQLLNISLSQVIDDIIDQSLDSIGVFQELCKESCLASGVLETQRHTSVITHDCLTKAIQKKVVDYSSRHIRSIETFAEQKIKVAKEIPLFICYYFIVYLFNLDFKTIDRGLKRADIQLGIKSIHHRPDDVRASDMSNFLHNITQAQIRKNIIPPLFDYDRSTKKLKVIDSTLYFFLRNANKMEILSDLEKPMGLS